MRRLCLGIAMVLMAGGVAGKAMAAEAVVEKGKKVAFDYTLTVDGAVVDTSAGKKPLEYTQGDNTLIPGLVKRIEGMRAGEEKDITVPPEEGYGLVDPKAFQDVPRSNLPGNMTLKAGMLLQAKDDTGRAVGMRVVEVKDDAVRMDFNHPLAGKTLNFKVKIVSIQ